MAVRIKFDNTHNVISPTFVLATRSGRKLGAIPAVNVSVSDSFNSRFELEFRVEKFINGEEYHLWDSIKDFKLVWCSEWDVWFEMYVTVQDDNDTVKQVSCVSVGEAELSQINLHDIQINTEDDIARDDYVVTVLFDAQNPEGSLLTRIMEKAPHYTIKHVDTSIAKIQRMFTFDGVSLYDAFQSIAEEIDCIFVIDSSSADDGSISRSISVYDLESYCMECGTRGNFTDKCSSCGSSNITTGYGDDTTIFVSTENLADNITLRTDTDSVKNCFRLEAGDDLMTATVRNCNPNGTQYIWYVSDDIKNDMSDELVAKLDKYDEMYSYYQREHEVYLDSGVLSDYNALIEKYSAYRENLRSISSPIVGYPALMNAYYDTIDFYLFLHDGLMPSPELAETNATEQAALLTADALSPVAVQNINTVSTATASSAVLAMAKTIVNPNYQVKVKDSSLSGTTWTGNFTITNYGDDGDTATSATVKVTITGDYETYVKQRINKVLSSIEDDEDITDITTLFGLTLDRFNTEIKKYCLTSLQTFHDACQSCLDILIEQGIADKDTWANQTPDLYTSMYIPYYQKLDALAAEIKLRESEIATIIGVYDADGDLVSDGLQTLIATERAKIQDALNFEQYIGTDLWLEFVAYRREDTYSNENYISDGLNNSEIFKMALDFIEVANKEIYKSATQQHSLSASLQNLLVMKEFAPIVDMFTVGNWIRVQIDDAIYRLRLISYTIDFDDLDNIPVEFSDVKKYIDGVTDSADILRQAASMASSYDTTKRQAQTGEVSKRLLDNWVQKGLDATSVKIMSNADNQNQTWDSHGMLFREYDPITDSYSDCQLKIINSTLAVTDDNWKTIKTAVGGFYYFDPVTGELSYDYGVNAELIVGKLLLGENLGIYSGDNSMTFDKNGLVITNDVNTFKVNPGDENGKLLVLSNKTDDILWVDKNGCLHINGDGSGLDITANDAIEGISSTIKQTAESISQRIDGVDEQYAELRLTVDGVTITDDSGTTRLRGDSIQTGSITADKLILTGSITFSDLDSDTQDTINGLSDTIDNLDIPKLPGYIQETYIDSVRIEAPSIYGGSFYGEDFNVILDDVPFGQSSPGGFKLYGAYESPLLQIGYFYGDTPTVTFESPASGNVSWIFPETDFYGRISFTGVTDEVRFNSIDAVSLRLKRDPDQDTGIVITNDSSGSGDTRVNRLKIQIYGTVWYLDSARGLYKE